MDTDQRIGDEAAARDGGPGDEAEGPAGGQRPGLFRRAIELWRNPAYRFVLLFLLYLLIAAAVYPPFTEKFPDVIFGMMSGTAQIEYWLLSIFTDEVFHNGNLVTFMGFPVRIIVECTGIYEVLIFCCAVLAFPTLWSKRGVGLLMGIPLLYLFNVVRISVLMLVGKFSPSIFDFMHIYFWQATLILMITSVWLRWIFKVVRDD